MPDIVVVQTSAAGASVAVDVVGGTAAYQMVKLVDGAAESTSPIAATSGVPATSSMGLIVVVKDGHSVSAVVSGTVSVVGSVAVSGAAQVSGTVTANGNMTVVSTIGTLLGTVAVNVVAGAAGGGSVTTAQPNISATGQMVWVVGGQSTTAAPVFVSQINPPSAGGGSVTTTQAAQTGQLIWFAPTQTLASVAVVNTIVTQLGTQIVSVVPGLSVSAVVSGTVTALLPGSTTGSSGMSGVLVWLGASQSVLIAGQSVTIQQGASVSAQVSGTVSVVGSVALVHPVVVTGTSIGISGISFTTGSELTVTATALQAVVRGTVSIISGAFVSVNPGVSVTVVAGTVSVSGTVAVTGTIQNIASVSTILGTAVVTLATGGTIATLLGTVNVAVAGTATVTGTVSALDVGRTNVLIIITSTSVGISGTTMPFTIYVGMSAGVAGTTSYVVPAGKTLRILAMNAVVQNSVTTSPAIVRIGVLASTALPTWTSAVPVLAQVAVQAVSATVGYSGAAVQVADVPAGATIGIAHTIGTSGASVVGAQVAGYLFP